MGVDASALSLLALARTKGADFSRTVTIGRHRLDVPSEDLEDFFRAHGRDDLARIAPQMSGYCETLLTQAFGAREVKSIDASDYEQASIIHDFNTPMRGNETYSAVIDLGTLEHVFNVAVAFDNVAQLAAPGAHILHVLPANNLVGHGFYQFSPEFFFQLYAPERGYTGTRVFAAPGGQPDVWYEVRAPRDVGARVNITSRDQLYLLVLTQKVGDPVPLTEKPIQQSDYMALWGQEQRSAKAKPRRSPVERWLRSAFTSLRHRTKVARRDVSTARPDLTPVRVRALIGAL